MFERRLRDAELEACLAIAPRHLGDELVGRERALAGWRSLLQSAAFNNGVFFAEGPPRDREILAFGAGAFVLPGYVDAELATPRPGLNARFIAAIANGDSPVLDKAQLRRANTHRIAEARPQLFLEQVHGDGDVTRGKQKRHHVLAYLREHPEELRPYEFDNAAHKSPV